MSTPTVSLLPLLALSIRQPWAWMILNAGKDIENRSWQTDYRGRFLIHAAKGMTQDEYEDAFYFAEDYTDFDPSKAPEKSILDRGGIVGCATLTDCVRGHSSSWAIEGQWHFVLADVRPIPFIPCKGIL